MEFYTIGVFNSTEEEFFGKLTAAGIDTFCDIRQLRGVRGATYAFVNSKRLQKKLQELGISYRYVTGLTPTTEIRQMQKDRDAQLGERIRDRTELAPSFAEAYTKSILGKFDFDQYLRELQQGGARKIVLFCVEQHAHACHRSLVAASLSELGFAVTHL